MTLLSAKEAAKKSVDKDKSLNEEVEIFLEDALNKLSEIIEARIEKGETSFKVKLKNITKKKLLENPYVPIFVSRLEEELDKSGYTYESAMQVAPDGGYEPVITINWNHLISEVKIEETRRKDNKWLEENNNSVPFEF